jgi:flavin-dependent thymidylate synthase
VSNEIIRAADAAQYAREAIPAEDRGRIRVRLLNATPDPLGSVAALCAQYEGRVIRNLSDVTEDERRKCLDDMGKTVLNGPLEAVQFHWQIEGVTRSITHQMVRSRASFFAQESLRFAVPEGEWWKEIPRPPWLSKAEESSPSVIMWKRAMIQAQQTYEYLLDQGMPAEEARGVLPHDMPTRIHWVMDLRTLLAEAGKRTCTQAQFPWRLIFGGMAQALRTFDDELPERRDQWQFREIAKRLRPVCFQTGSCGFMAAFDRSCKIRGRVDAFARNGVDPKYWTTARTEDGELIEDVDGAPFQAINDFEWAADPSAARS